jgi:hypothetical protein
MTFNIGSQSGGTFNNVAGSQYINGGQQTFVQPAEQAIRELHELLRRLPLDPRTAGRASAEVSEMAGAIQATPPDQGRVAHAAERLTGLLESAGLGADPPAARPGRLARPARRSPGRHAHLTLTWGGRLAGSTA